MRVPDPRAELRRIVYSGDGAAVVALLSAGPWPDNSLQLIGDGLIVALNQRHGDPSRLARDCVEGLRERGWDGDDELADHLEALLGSGPIPPLRPLPISLEELALVVEGDPVAGGGRVDLRTGDLWPHAAIEYEEEIIGDEDDDSADSAQWMWVESTGSRAGYRDMQDFIGTVSDSDRAGRLDIAIQGRGAFRRFTEVLARWPLELQRWYDFSDERQTGRARAWLADAGYRALPPTSPSPQA